MLGVGKAAPAQFILRGKTNLRRISAAGQKAGFTAYPSHWASIWWDVIGGQCIFFVNTMQKPLNLIRFKGFSFAKKDLNGCQAIKSENRFFFSDRYNGKNTLTT